VRQLVAKGNRVIAACRRPEEARKELGAELPDVAWTTLDVASPASIESWAAEVQGIAPHLDVVINNAGISGPRLALDDFTQGDFLDVLTTNAIGPFLVVQQLRKQGLLGGDQHTLIANVTSKVGSVDDNKSGGGYAYRASKSALNIISKSMSIDLAGENCTTTLLHPGWVATGMVGFKGLIDTQTSVAGMIGILEKDPAELQGAWFDYKNEAIPW
jgi:NAD(P)-dependent dehydrogenase (short-subunit alcohol dehydrogenase family)